jgi:hypothetical protein
MTVFRHRAAVHQGAVLASGKFPATSAMGGKMYEAPVLERYGTFRALTQGGFNDISDTFTANSVDNCRVVPGTDPVTGLPIDIITCIRSGL